MPELYACILTNPCSESVTILTESRQSSHSGTFLSLVTSHPFPSYTQFHQLEQHSWQLPLFHFLPPSYRSAISIGFQLAGFKCDVNGTTYVLPWTPLSPRCADAYTRICPPSFLQCAVLIPFLPVPFFFAVGEPVGFSSCRQVWNSAGKTPMNFCRFISIEVKLVYSKGNKYTSD